VSSSTSKTSLDKKFRFGRITIWDLPMELGNHPPTSGGAPITVGWKSETPPRTTYVDNYELCKNPRGDLKMTAKERAIILLRAGYTIQQIAKACEQAQETLKQREASWRVAQRNNKQLERNVIGRSQNYGAAA
jgi:hypothetical protein